MQGGESLVKESCSNRTQNLALSFLEAKEKGKVLLTEC